MLSVIIATLDSEAALVQTLAALVSGATSGILSEVILADGGSRDDTAAVADVAGCHFMAVEGSLARRLKAAAARARTPYLLFLRPGVVPDVPWTGDAGRFMQQAANDSRAAIFRRGAVAQPGLNGMLSLITAAVWPRPRPEQGLLISRRFYEELGGHSESAAGPETELLRRIGRQRIVTLATSAFALDT
jgi:hypothetical protein